MIVGPLRWDEMKWRFPVHGLSSFMLLALLWPTACTASPQCTGQPVPCSAPLFQESQAICTSQHRADILPPPPPPRLPSVWTRVSTIQRHSFLLNCGYRARSAPMANPDWTVFDASCLAPNAECSWNAAAPIGKACSGFIQPCTQHPDAATCNANQGCQWHASPAPASATPLVGCRRVTCVAALILMQ